MVSNILLYIFFYDKSFGKSSALVASCDCMSCVFPISVFFVSFVILAKTGGVLGYPIQDFQLDIPSRKSQMRFPV